MKTFTVPIDARRELLNVSQQYHYAVAKLANEKVGYTPSTISGIFKYEGGILVRSKEIHIGEGYAKDDFMWHKEASPEEIATAEAIEEVSRIPVSVLATFPKMTIGDPLRSFFNVK
jgi:hypothetical protein